MLADYKFLYSYHNFLYRTERMPVFLLHNLGEKVTKSHSKIESEKRKQLNFLFYGCQNFLVLLSPLLIVAVLTKMSYADALGKLFTITENKTGHPKLKRQALFKDDEMSTNFCLNHLPSFCNNDDVIYKKKVI